MNKIKIIGIASSPREEESISKIMLDHFYIGLKPFSEIRTFYPYKMDIEYCDGCLKCHKDKEECPIEDDMRDIYKYLYEADIIIFSCPVYCGNMNAVMKNIIDRMDGLLENKIKYPKRCILISTCSKPNNKEFDMITSQFNFFCKEWEFGNAGEILICGSHRPIDEKYQQKLNLISRASKQLLTKQKIDNEIIEELKRIDFSVEDYKQKSYYKFD